ncbi:MAG: WD40 repeat domain-containing protein, partial [Sphaerospermopsis kisseleviana]
KPSEFQSLFLGQFPEQQLKAGNLDKYYQTLTDFDFISLKINYPKFGIESLVKDYLLIEDPEILELLADDEKLKSEQIKTLKLIQQTLELSFHVVNQDRHQLVSQLWGRLQSFQNSDIQKILADAAQSKSEITRLRPLTASLTTPGGSLLRTLTGHKNRIRTIAITPDGTKAVSGSDDNTLNVWDLETGTKIHTLIGHNKRVRAAAITPDGTKAVSASNDNILKVWDLDTGTEISTLTGHNHFVRVIAITPDGKKAVSSSDDNTLKLWDLEERKEISNFTGDTSIISCAVSPDGLMVVAGEQSGRVHFLRLEGGFKNE